jgi:hypothetical protein
MLHLGISIWDAETSGRRHRRVRLGNDDRGTILVVVLLSMTVLAALGIALSLTTSTETVIAANYGWSAETFYAADAAVEQTIQELSIVADWTEVLSGRATSAFIDGAPGPRTLPDGSQLNLQAATDALNCGHVSCSADDLIARSSERPWGPNNPIWRIYVHVPFEALVAANVDDSHVYVAVWIADDPLDNDGDPLVDGDESSGTNPGLGIVQLRAEAYGPAGARRIIEVALARHASNIRVLSWREVSQ